MKNYFKKTLVAAVLIVLFLGGSALINHRIKADSYIEAGGIIDKEVAGRIGVIWNRPNNGDILARDSFFPFDWRISWTACSNAFETTDFFKLVVYLANEKDWNMLDSGWSAGTYIAEYKLSDFTEGRSQNILNKQIKVPKDFPTGKARLYFEFAWRRKDYIIQIRGYKNVNISSGGIEILPPLPSDGSKNNGGSGAPTVSFPVIDYFRSNKNTVIINPLQQTPPQIELSWKASNFDNCYITSSPENESLKGKNIDFQKDSKTTISIDKTTTFSLTCSKDGNPVTSPDVKVRVFTPLLQEVKP